MKKWILLLLLATTMGCSLPVDANPYIRIRLKSDQTQLNFVGKNFRLNQSASKFAESANSHLQQVAVSSSKNIQEKVISVRLQQKNRKNIWLVQYSPSEVEKIFVQDRLLIRADGLRSNGQKVSDQVLLVAKNNRLFDVVGIESMNDYLVGVVAHEMPRSWPIEALKAQAIVARSYALATQKEKRTQHFDLESSVLDQVFAPMAAQNTSELINVRRAVIETQSIILKDSKQEILKAFYHADCGGQTTTAQNVWGKGEPGFVSVSDKWCPLSPRGQWRYEITYPVLQKKLQTHFALSDSSKLISLQLLNHRIDQRVTTLTAHWENGLTQNIAGDELRKILGYSELKSLKFDLKSEDNKLLFTGAGFGHGVGMCQWGTKKMAELGSSYQKIIQHYYPGMKLVSL